MRTIVPNRALIFMVLGPIIYLVMAQAVPGPILLNVFNSFAWGIALVLSITWLGGAYQSFKRGAEDGEEQLVLAIFMLWFVVFMQRNYVIAFNWFGRPQEWVDSAWPGFWPYSFTLIGFLFLVATVNRPSGITKRGFVLVLLAALLGGGLAGCLITLSIQAY